MGEPATTRGHEGPIGGSQTKVHPLARDVLKAASALGYPVVKDINAGTREGFGLTQANIAGGYRQSAAAGYLGLPAVRGNLVVKTGVCVERLLFENARCTGVRVRVGKASFDSACGGEVVVSTGAIATPALLMRSGVGPGAVLARAAINPVHAGEGIGANLQEHGAIAVGLGSKVPTVNMEGQGWRAVRSGFEWLFKRSGPIAMSVVQVNAFVRSLDGLSAPDVQFQFVPLGYDDSGDQPRMARAPQVGFTINPCRPKSRGRITIASGDPIAAPVIDHQLFGHTDDIAVLTRGAEIVRRLVATAPLAGKLSGELYPAGMARNEEGWEAYAARAQLGVRMRRSTPACACAVCPAYASLTPR